MFVKKFKRKCSVRGCKNTANVYLVSKRREMGNTIGICTDCLKEAMSSIEAYTEPPKVVKEDKPLFPHPELKVTLSSVAEELKPVEVIDAVAEDIPVAEDTVAIEEPIIDTAKPEEVLPSEATQTNGRRKTKKK